MIGGDGYCAAAALGVNEGGDPRPMRAAKRTLQFHDFVLFWNGYQL
jgi:hypothetical protein